VDAPGGSAPTRAIPVGVPGEGGLTIEAEGYAPRDYVAAFPPPPAFPTRNDTLDETPPADADKLASFGAFYEIRETPVRFVVIKPASYDPAAKRARVFERVRVTVRFPNAAAVSRPADDPLLRDAILNYDVAKRWGRSLASRKPARTSSALASGTWYRFEAPESGMYVLEREDLTRFGIDPATVDPRTIKIYNNGGGELPEDKNDERPFDLEEIAVLVEGEDDGVFDERDRVIFPGRGAEFWDYKKEFNQVGRYVNDFSEKNYFWITAGGAAGKRMPDVSSLNESDATPRNSSLAYAYEDDNIINVGATGRLFVGDEFTNVQPARVYETMLDYPISDSSAYYRVGLVNASDPEVNYSIVVNGVEIASGFCRGTNGDSYQYGEITEATAWYEGEFVNNLSRMEITFSSAETFLAYIDFFHLIYRRSLQAADDEIELFTEQSLTRETGEYRLTGFSHDDIRVFDVSDFQNARRVVNPVKRSDGEFFFQTVESDSTIYRYLACTPERFKTPINPEPVANQDLKGSLAEARFVIVAHPTLASEAERLAEHKATLPAPISTVVVEVDDVYNEFSCGAVDPSAIRDFLKYCYDHWSEPPEYVLLFGDATFDYKDVYGKGLNLVPTWESIKSLNEISSYASDAYFVDVSGSAWSSDMAIGRAPARTIADARAFVDKTIRYETDAPRGPWRNRVALVADDQIAEGKAESIMHSHQSENLDRQLLPDRMEARKIYLAAFPTVVTAGGLRKPAANQAIIDAMNEGAALVNFYGHGNSELWTHEQVFVASSSLQRVVTDRLFFLTAATCGFGDFDKLEGQSGAEQMALKSDGGSVGSITASRPVYSGQNQALNETFYGQLFLAGRDTLNLPHPVGLAYYQTKLVHSNVNARKFSLLGDPTVRLAFPQYEASIDSINGAPSGTPTTLRALGTTRVDGTVRKPDGAKWSGFTGEGRLAVFDSDYETPLPAVKEGFTMRTQGGAIFNGRVSIVDGEYSASFVAPKDLSQSGENGKVVFYFTGEDADGLGHSDDVIISGVDASTIDDGRGPDIEITFDDPAFDGGRLANRDATLVATISDETGVNTSTAGVGHLMKAVIDGNEANPIPLGDRFVGDLDAGGKSGVVEYPLVDLDPGTHTVRVDAYDVFNNHSSSELAFEVVETGELTIKNVMNYPNPTAGSTVFTFQHNYSSPLDVTVSIYTVAGRRIREITAPALFDRFARIQWDGRDYNGDPLANGVYLYRITAKTIDGEESESALGKLAIAR
jgi:hypothetical protein